MGCGESTWLGWGSPPDWGMESLPNWGVESPSGWSWGSLPCRGGEFPVWGGDGGVHLIGVRGGWFSLLGWLKKGTLKNVKLSSV